MKAALLAAVLAAAAFAAFASATTPAPTKVVGNVEGRQVALHRPRLWRRAIMLAAANALEPAPGSGPTSTRRRRPTPR